MIKTRKHEVFPYHDEWKYSKNGSVLHSPFQNFDNVLPISLSKTYGCLTFAGHDLEKSQILNDINVFCLEFSGECSEMRDREKWANPIRGKVLRRLSDEGKSWYIGFNSDISTKLIQKNNWDVDEQVFQFFSKKDPMRVATVLSERPNGIMYGSEKRMFFEILNSEIEWAVQQIWQIAEDIYKIEGYNLPSGRMDLIRNWDQRKRDDLLFSEVMDNCRIAFFTYPAEPRHFKFVTKNMNYCEFLQKINIESLQKDALENEHEQ